METLRKKLYLKLFKIKGLILIWITEYPYKRYPKKNFYRRFVLMNTIKKRIEDEIFHIENEQRNVIKQENENNFLKYM